MRNKQAFDDIRERLGDLRAWADRQEKFWSGGGE